MLERGVPATFLRFSARLAARGRFPRLLGGELACKMMSMTKSTEVVLAEALRLDPDSRAELAVELLASLDGPSDPDAEAAWAVEIERRVAAILAGTAKLEPWADVKRRIEIEILGR